MNYWHAQTDGHWSRQIGNLRLLVWQEGGCWLWRINLIRPLGVGDLRLLDSITEYAMGKNKGNKKLKGCFDTRRKAMNAAHSKVFLARQKYAELLKRSLNK